MKTSALKDVKGYKGCIKAAACGTWWCFYVCFSVWTWSQQEKHMRSRRWVQFFCIRPRLRLWTYRFCFTASIILRLFSMNVSHWLLVCPSRRQDFDVIRWARSIWRKNGQKVKYGTNRRRFSENTWRTLIVVVFFGSRHLHPLWLGLSLGLAQQHVRLPFDSVAQAHGQALVPSFIVPDQIVQTLEMRLAHTPYCLMAESRK